MYHVQIYEYANCIRVLSVSIKAPMNTKSVKIWGQPGLVSGIHDWYGSKQQNGYRPGESFLGNNFKQKSNR